MKTTVNITTPRLTLRPLGPEYLESTHAYASDRENTKYMMFLPNDTTQETLAFLKECEAEWAKDAPEYCEFGIFLEGQHIGAVSLYMEEAPDSIELGWILARQWQGHGYATEAARGAMDFARRTFGVHRFTAHCDTENAASQAVMQRLGMTRVDCQGGRHNRIDTGERYEYIYAMELQD